MELQEKSELSRQEFYIQFIEQAELKEKVEVRNV
jgi:hypothetical protein